MSVCPFARATCRTAWTVGGVGDQAQMLEAGGRDGANKGSKWEAVVGKGPAAYLQEPQFCRNGISPGHNWAVQTYSQWCSHQERCRSVKVRELQQSGVVVVVAHSSWCSMTLLEIAALRCSTSTAGMIIASLH